MPASPTAGWCPRHRRRGRRYGRCAGSQPCRSYRLHSPVDLEPTEVQVVLGGVEFREVLDVEPLVGFTLGLGLRVPPLGEGLAQSAVRRRAHPVDAPVDGVEMLLLVGYAGIGILTVDPVYSGQSRPAGHQPRASHSSSFGRPSPRVVSEPWPGYNGGVVGIDVEEFRRHVAQEALEVAGLPRLPTPPGKRQSPVTS